MAALGTVKEFDPDLEEWSSYVDRLEQLLIVHEIAREKQRAILLSSVGPKTYSVLKDLLAPEKPSTKSFEELVECLQKHFTPSILKIAERFKLVKRVQADSEEIKKYAVALRKLATICQYGAFLDDALTQCFVCGLQNSGIQRKLLLESDLTFEKAVKLAEAIEKAGSEVKKNIYGTCE